MATNTQAIIDAAETILAETGKIPTVDAVRSALGGGSFSTLNPVLREWRQQHQATPAAEDIPLRVRETLERSVGALWGAFRTEIEERIGLARGQAEERAIEAESERDQALAEVARLEATLEELRVSTTQTQADLVARLEQAKGELATAKEEIATFTERTTQLEKHITAQDREIKGARDDLHKARRETVTMQDHASDLMKQLTKEQGLRAQAEASVQRWREEAEAFRVQIQTQEQALTKEQNKCRELEVENARLTERSSLVDELRAQLETLRQALAASESVGVTDNGQAQKKPSRARRKDSA